MEHSYLNMRSSVRRVSVFSASVSDGQLLSQTLPYLEGLRAVSDSIIVVCNGTLAPDQYDALAPYALHVIAEPHDEYHYGCYKRGTLWAFDNGLLDTAESLILCNDTFLGPVGSFLPMFEIMDARQLDFWGATDSREHSYHVQTYFLNISRNVFISEVFNKFISKITSHTEISQVIHQYELGLTRTLCDAGFLSGVFIENRLAAAHPSDPAYSNIIFSPLYLLQQGLPLVNITALTVPHLNMDGQNRLLAWLRRHAPAVYELASFDVEIKQFEDATDIAFSLIMATYNRASSITAAIRAALAQNHENFELIIVDDGSTDNTQFTIEQTFQTEIATGRIKYIRSPENIGVSNARNLGIALACNPWIGYVDSDNILRPYFLSMIANTITQNRTADAFYGKIFVGERGIAIGSPFNRNALLHQNFIDIGVFVHRRSLVSKWGGFDPDLRRLVDWDLIIRYTQEKEPIFVPRVFLDYHDDPNDVSRITVKESLTRAKVRVHSKYGPRETVSTLILSRNNRDHIAQAIESALGQRGNFEHEIILSDDGSIDGTAQIVAYYAEKYPLIIRNVGRTQSVGFSENYRYAIQNAAANFISVLKGGDTWADPEKNAKQLECLIRTPTASMIFSRIEPSESVPAALRLPEQPHGFNSRPDGNFVLSPPSLNLGMNFSSFMSRRTILNDLPSVVYDPQINEVSLPFYLDRLGPIGFLNQVTAVCRTNLSYDLDEALQRTPRERKRDIFKAAMRLAKPEYRQKIQDTITVMA
ncbi:glycosyltransferase involved in cell wall biosynthesis [Gluconacetobacter liquefaciens]|uniref:Glycosyltransferase involved in cell wall biosynthesis n=2 Tax=Gluconacetobacter liquefaciens TaxID=89584 RepID=A0A370G7L0_GLULI|nr:glycosyltransferase involved in cell wall biosynthesis [Gluconacetobacter liquefaciens]